MKNVFFLTAACALLLLSSCRKGIDPIHYFPNPLSSDNQVVEYHKTSYDNENRPPYPAHFPYLFKKTYDRSGKTVTEIDCCFEDSRHFSELVQSYYHEFKVSQRGRMIYLINKQLTKSNIPDTVARVALNEDGRP